MKKFFFVLSIILVHSCKTKTPVEPDLPLLDFEATNYLTASELSKFKTLIKCGETAYWEGKNLKLQGYLFIGNIDNKRKKFFIYDNDRIFESTNRAFEVYYSSSDSVAISKTLLDNVGKYCNMKVSCFTGTIYTEGCRSIINFFLEKNEDITF